MADATKIEWADATFNPWWGCERVSPGCAHCYADGEARRRGHRIWGAGHGFRFLSDGNWAKPLRWARIAREGRLPNGEENRDGHRPRVFCASMADVFEERQELDEHRERLFDLILATPELDWLILTKRPEFARSWLEAWHPCDGCEIYPKPLPNVWLGVSIENARFTWRADVLREIPAALRFISAEPLLGSLFATDGKRQPLNLDRIDWCIVGGESGPKARPFHLEHAREIIRACRARDVICCQSPPAECCGRPLATGECCGQPVQGSECCGEFEQLGPGPAVFMKQLGARPLGRTYVPAPTPGEVLRMREGEGPLHLSDRKGGNWDEWPADLRIREFPRSAA